MKDEISYRQGQVTDIETIVDFQGRMADETEGIHLDREICRRGVSAVFSDPRLGRYLVAELEGEPVGTLMITYEWSDWRASQVWWIQSVYVASEARRRGIYAGLYQHVLNLVNDDSTVAGIRLYVDRRNIAAQKVYERLGMNGEHYQVFEKMKDEG